MYWPMFARDTTDNDEKSPSTWRELEEYWDNAPLDRVDHDIMDATEDVLMRRNPTALQVLIHHMGRRVLKRLKQKQNVGRHPFVRIFPVPCRRTVGVQIVSRTDSFGVDFNVDGTVAEALSEVRRATCMRLKNNVLVFDNEVLDMGRKVSAYKIDGVGCVFVKHKDDIFVNVV